MKMVFHPLKANPKFGSWEALDFCCKRFGEAWAEEYIGPLQKGGWQEPDKGAPSIYKSMEVAGGFMEMRSLPIDHCPFCGKALDVEYKGKG